MEERRRRNGGGSNAAEEVGEGKTKCFWRRIQHLLGYNAKLLGRLKACLTPELCIALH
jgi:hypothetical protein